MRISAHDRVHLRPAPSVVELEVDRARVALRRHCLRAGTMPAHDEGARLRRGRVSAGGNQESEGKQNPDSHAQSVRFRSMPRAPVTVLIHTLDEIENIEACIRSVEWADEIDLLDSFSKDGTVELVREKFPRVRVEQREYLGAASAKNYAIDRATHDWIFVVAQLRGYPLVCIDDEDPVERVTPKLRDEILRTLEGPLDLWAYSVGRLNFML